MKKLQLKNEIFVWGIILIPFVYLVIIWNDLPDRIPVHFNLEGHPDRWGSKYNLLLITSLLNIITYLLFLFAEILDPKKRIQQMGRKYYRLRMFIMLAVSLLSAFIIYSSSHQGIKYPNIIFIIIGVLLIVFGNYFQTIKPNYFIGIRTPWTLENEEVWKKTHKMGGWLWLVGGILIVIFALILPSTDFRFIFLTIIGIITLIPMAYSYLQFKKSK